jgi:tRNA A37 methylthiotransferase MiaB
MTSAAPPTKVAIVTLGCGRNEVDSANAAGLLAASGYELVDDPERADAVVVNTCAFIETKASRCNLRLHGGGAGQDRLVVIRVWTVRKSRPKQSALR